MPPWAGPIPAGFFDQTVRQVVRISLGGERVRVRLSNEFGFRPVEVEQPILLSREPQGRFRRIPIVPLPSTESPRLRFYRVLRC
jgi:hypothetical protein